MDAKTKAEATALEAQKAFTEAVRFLYQNQYDKSLVAANKALQLNPYMVEAWNTRASSLQMLGRDRDAISSYLQGLKLNPNDEVIVGNLLGILFTNVFNNTKQGEIIFNSFSNEEKHLIEKLVSNQRRS